MAGIVHTVNGCKDKKIKSVFFAPVLSRIRKRFDLSGME